MSRPLLDYRNRPAKAIERHLIVDLCRRVLQNHPGVEFQYIGMGALEFLDFALMHRALGLTQMVSIEQQSTERHEFNKPFRSIRIVQGHSSAVLNGKHVDLSRPSIVWLDYTGGLDDSMLGDIEDVSRIMPSPSLLFVTVNAVAKKLGERMSDLEERISPARIPEWVSDDNLNVHGLMRAQRQMMSFSVKLGLESRATSPIFQQLVNLHYQDNANMQTFGGLFLPAGTDPMVAISSFEDLDFVIADDKILDLRVPVITAAERFVLDRQLPLAEGIELVADHIPPKDLVAYQRVYKYMHLAGLQSAAESTWIA